ncbi:MAG: HEAT repeat domain-containing protein [Planctomycetes bacterium]|nr:HEAT repeat domain-containing protein [Planctomycetota bacterium]
MLEGLQKIDWAKLTHGYGRATDLPDLIRTLVCGTLSEREDAISGLWAALWHRGRLSAATVVAAPFLLELLEEASVEAKDAILVLLAHLASGRAQRERPWTQPTHDAIVAGASTYVRLLEGGSPAVRAAAAYTLAVCRERCTELGPILRRRFSVEEDPQVRASIVLALGVLHGRENLSFYRNLMSTEQDKLVRFAVALALARLSSYSPPAEVTNILREVAASPWTIETAYRRLPWRENSVAADAQAALEALQSA